METKNTALILVDVQNAFCSADGSYIKRGNRILNKGQALKNIKTLLSLARKNNWLVIFTKLEFKPDYSDANLLVKRNPEIIKLKGYIKNTWDSKIIDDLKPKNNGIVIAKNRYDPFLNPNLIKALIKNNIRKIIIAGFLTNVCVESTARSAFDRDFEVFVVKDATSSYSKDLKDSSLATIGKHFGSVASVKNLEYIK